MDKLHNVPQNDCQCGSEVKGEIGRVRRQRVRIAAGATALLLTTLLAGSAAVADDMFLASGAFESLGRWAFLFVVWIVITPFLEALILTAFLKLGYPKALGYAILANLVSVLLSLLWAGLFQEGGWKTALVDRNWAVLPRLLVRSYIVTAAEEGIVVALLVRNTRSIGTVFTSVLVANLASYVMITVIFLCVFSG